MKWRGETSEQWFERITHWHRHFCWLPRQMMSGSWIWLEPCWAKMGKISGHWRYSDAVAEPEDVGPQTPPPPRMRK